MRHLSRFPSSRFPWELRAACIQAVVGSVWAPTSATQAKFEEFFTEPVGPRVRTFRDRSGKPTRHRPFPDVSSLLGPCSCSARRSGRGQRSAGSGISQCPGKLPGEAVPAQEFLLQSKKGWISDEPEVCSPAHPGWYAQRRFWPHYCWSRRRHAEDRQPPRTPGLPSAGSKAPQL